MRIAVLAAAIAVIGGQAFAASDLDAFRTLSGSQVSFALSGGYSNATLTVSGPDGFYARVYSKAGNPSIDLIKAKATADGIYKYEITAASPEKVKVKRTEDDGRDGDAGEMRVGVSASGSFMVKGGLIVELDAVEE